VLEQSQLGSLADGIAAAALATLAASILLPLTRSGQLRRNRLDLAAALVFLSCAVGHAIQAQQGVGGGPALVAWDGLTAVIAAGYLVLRRNSTLSEEGGALYEDVRRRQHELAGQTMAANVREELATERAAAADQRLARVFASTPVGMAVVDPHGHVTRANPALARVLGRGPNTDLDGVRLPDLIAEPDRPALEAMLSGAGSGAGLDVRIPRPEATPAWGHVSATPLGDEERSVLVQIEDTTERHQAEDRLEQLTTHDPLTGLANRLLLHTRAAAALRQANRTGCYVACLFVDLDRFRVVNDSLGHAAGDRLLTTVAARLAEVVRPGDTVARVGDDEFGLLLVGLEHQAEAEIVANRVRAALDGSVDLDQAMVATSASVGVAVARPGDKATSETLIRDADTALCRAKAGG